MRIAQVAPLFESVPPRLYGGTERVVSYLTEELVQHGHDVTLYASGDSVTQARLVPCCGAALRLADCLDPLSYHFLMLERVYREADQFDLIHFHCDYLHFPLSRRHGIPRLTTLHGRLDLPELRPVYDEFSQEPVVSISESQRRPLPQARWEGTVHHGLPMDLLEFHERPGRYLAFLGRVTPDKGLDRAIQIARRTDLPLRVAAKVDRADRDYFADVIKPMLVRAGSLVEFIGEIGDAEKSAFLGGALAVLFPIDWPEPFGLVMIESLACGTPVIAMRRGSVPEILEHGVSGFVVDDVESAVRAVGALPCLSRRGCRRAFEERFSARRMAQDYLAIYERLVGGEPTAQRPDSRGGAVAAPPVVASADHNGRPGRVLAR